MLIHTMARHSFCSGVQGKAEVKVACGVGVLQNKCQARMFTSIVVVVEHFPH